MARTLDFNKVAKQYLTIKLADEKQTVLMISTPTKAVMNELLILEGSVDAVQDGTDMEALDNLYSATAKIMSRNKGGIEIKKEYLEGIFDFEDLILFFKEYMKFVGEVGKTKN